METFKNTAHVIARFVRKAGDRGATMVEYVLLVALVALIGVAGWTFVGSAISDTASNTCETIADSQSQIQVPNTPTVSDCPSDTPTGD